MSAPQPRTGPTVARIILGLRLRRLREDSGITRHQAGAVIHSSESKISRMELGRVGCQDRDVSELADHYGLTDPARRAALLDLARASRRRNPGNDLLPRWLTTYVDLEAAATLIRTYEPQLIPGLLQTASYARTVIAEGRPAASAADIDRRVSLRLDRTQLLIRPDPPRLWAVIDEATLHRTIGGPVVMGAQLDHLLEAARLPSITLQVMPTGSGAHAAEGGAFSLLRFSYPELSDIVYIEHLTHGFHLDDPAEVMAYTQAADQLAAQAATPATSLEIIADIRDRIRSHLPAP